MSGSHIDTNNEIFWSQPIKLSKMSLLKDFFEQHCFIPLQLNKNKFQHRETRAPLQAYRLKKNCLYFLYKRKNESSSFCVHDNCTPTTLDKIIKTIAVEFDVIKLQFYLTRHSVITKGLP